MGTRSMCCIVCLQTVGVPGPAGPSSGGGGRPWRGPRAGASGGGGTTPSRAPLSRSRSFDPDPRDPTCPRDVRGPSYPRDNRDPSYPQDARDPSYPRDLSLGQNYQRDFNRGPSYPRDHRDGRDSSTCYPRDSRDPRDPYAASDRFPRDRDREPRDQETASRQRGGGGMPMPPYRQAYPPGYPPSYSSPYTSPYGPGPGYPLRYPRQDMLPPPVLDDSDEGPSRCATFWHYVWKLSSCLCSHVTLVSLVIAYCILGAVTFEHLESANEGEVKKNITYRRSNVTEWLWDLTSKAPVLHQENWTLSAMERLQVFEKELLWAMRTQGWDGSDESNKQLQWTFSGALFYSIIVITTIGYGHIAPKTQIGKVVTIFYAILGIPLMLLCLSNIGDVMAQSFRFLYWRVCCYVCTRSPQPPPPRRARFIRAARPSTRSNRSLPFRRSGRVSTRSADGALGTAQAMVRSSHSDTEARYPDEDVDFRPTVGQPRYLDPGGANAPLGYPGAAGPVLFNKYALDREESGRARDGERRLRAQSVGREREGRRRGPPIAHGGSLPRHHRLNDRDPHRSSQRSSGYGSAAKVPSPRIMSPMGFGLHRQYLRAEESVDFLGFEGGDWDSLDGLAGGGTGGGAGGRMGPNRLRPVPIWLCVFLVVSYIFGGAYLFAKWEDWPFLDAAYFCFITLTTIGFGDFVPAQQVRKDEAEVSIALCSLYLLFGIALLAMSFNLVQEEVLSSVRSVARRLGIIKAEHDED